VRVDTERESVDESVGKILSYLEEHGYVAPAQQFAS